LTAFKFPKEASFVRLLIILVSVHFSFLVFIERALDFAPTGGNGNSCAGNGCNT
jgi:hypothetical protein